MITEWQIADGNILAFITHRNRILSEETMTQIVSPQVETKRDKLKSNCDPQLFIYPSYYFKRQTFPDRWKALIPIIKLIEKLQFISSQT